MRNESEGLVSTQIEQLPPRAFPTQANVTFYHGQSKDTSEGKAHACDINI